MDNSDEFIFSLIKRVLSQAEFQQEPTTPSLFERLLTALFNLDFSYLKAFMILALVIAVAIFCFIRFRNKSKKVEREVDFIFGGDEPLTEEEVKTELWVLHRRLLDILDHLKKLEFRAWKTNKDYVEECPEKILADVTTAYNAAVYGAEEITLSAITSYRDQIEALKHEDR